MWFLLLTVLLTLHSDGTAVKGVVTDEDGTPVKGVSVRFETVKKGGVLAQTETDEDGRFYISIPIKRVSADSEEEYILAFYAEGYIALKVAVSLNGGGTGKWGLKKGEIVELGVVSLKNFRYGLTVMGVSLCSVLVILTILVLVLRVSGFVINITRRGCR